MTLPLPSTGDEAASLTDRAARWLTEPQPPPPGEPWAGQSLAQGSAGTALFHIERARNGTGNWPLAQRWITATVSGEISAAYTSGLYLGAPAVAFTLHTAAGDTARYRQALTTVDQHVTDLAHRRASAATDRIRRQELPAFREYDIFHGLAGIGAHLLRRDPGGSALEAALTYLVALTQPIRYKGELLPGWWVGHDPHTRTGARYRHGHSNQGAAHGITGPLILLAQAARHGITVDGHHEAIATICAWLDTWQQPGTTGAWWPECISMDELRTGRTRQGGPARPSWCYGPPGIARALQLAGIATADVARKAAAEQHLLDCLSDPVQLDRLTDPGLCHGWAGTYQTAWRAANDAVAPALTATLPRLATALTHAARTARTTDASFLNGLAGTGLALTTIAHDVAPTSGWDACLLIN